jgi:hypothetical protein
MIPKPAPGAHPPAQEPAFDEPLLFAYMKYNEAVHVAGVLGASEGVTRSSSNSRSSGRPTQPDLRAICDRSASP